VTATLTVLAPCASCNPASCDHALTWWCADCDRWETCDDHCPGDLPWSATGRRRRRA
jgi:hypothetical protein